MLGAIRDTRIDAMRVSGRVIINWMAVLACNKHEGNGLDARTERREVGWQQERRAVNSWAVDVCRIDSVALGLDARVSHEDEQRPLGLLAC